MRVRVRVKAAWRCHVPSAPYPLACSGVMCRRLVRLRILHTLRLSQAQSSWWQCLMRHCEG